MWCPLRWLPSPDSDPFIGRELKLSLFGLNGRFTAMDLAVRKSRGGHDSPLEPSCIRFASQPPDTEQTTVTAILR